MQLETFLIHEKPHIDKPIYAFVKKYRHRGDKICFELLKGILLNSTIVVHEQGCEVHTTAYELIFNMLYLRHIRYTRRRLLHSKIAKAYIHNRQRLAVFKLTNSNPIGHNYVVMQLYIDAYTHVLRTRNLEQDFIRKVMKCR